MGGSLQTDRGCGTVRAHTRDTLRRESVALLKNWPSKSPDLNPQENVWAWAAEDVRKSERKRDTVAVFKRRVAASCQRYPSKLTLVAFLIYP